jgi:hypothetical protein
MEKYNPNKKVEPEEWLALDEDVRVLSIEEYHKGIDHELEDEQAMVMHCTIHAIVENQLALGVEYVPETLDKLIRQGLDRHESIHAIGAILIEDIYNLINGKSQEFSPKKYRRKLEKITAKRWLKGQY